jgi:N-acetylmuramoyl-L-alanine amidase
MLGRSFCQHVAGTARTPLTKRAARPAAFIALAAAAATALACAGCAPSSTKPTTAQAVSTQIVTDSPAADAAATTETAASAEELRAALDITELYYDDLAHGEKTAEDQKYIVLHDTEGAAGPADTIEWWEQNGSYVAAQFIVGTDGSIYQCVPVDQIAHHAGYGDTGNNVAFGVEDESRDDKRGTSSIGSDYADYGMNSYSIGIEMVHVGGEGDYPEAQLEALDGLIAYIDAYYGFESTIIDHKTWRSTNSDTSAEFAAYLANYQTTRTHDGSGR